MKKRLLLLFCILSCAMLVAGCSLVRSNENFKKSALEEQTDSFIENWFGADFQGTIETYQEQMDENTLAIYQDYAKQKEQYQGVKKKLKTEFTITTDSATVTETILCESGDKVLVSLTFNEDGSIQTDDSGNYTFKFEEYKSMGDQMAKAGLNTIMSMAIVFLVLIFISLLISCFKFIGIIGKNKAENKQTQTTVEAPAQAASDNENLVDDLELVAVITAAIAAATETESADGLVVRSIIRR